MIVVPVVAVVAVVAAVFAYMRRRRRPPEQIVLLGQANGYRVGQRFIKVPGTLTPNEAREIRDRGFASPLWANSLLRPDPGPAAWTVLEREALGIDDTERFIAETDRELGNV